MLSNLRNILFAASTATTFREELITHTTGSSHLLYFDLLDLPHEHSERAFSHCVLRLITQLRRCDAYLYPSTYTHTQVNKLHLYTV